MGDGKGRFHPVEKTTELIILSCKDLSFMIVVLNYSTNVKCLKAAGWRDFWWENQPQQKYSANSPETFGFKILGILYIRFQMQSVVVTPCASGILVEGMAKPAKRHFAATRIG